MGLNPPRSPGASDRMFVGLLDRCTGAVRRTLRRMRVPARDVSDLEQETWFAIWTALGRLDGAPPFEPEKFSTTIAFRKAADHGKARRRRPEQAASPSDPEPVDDRPTTEEHLVQRQEEAQARALVLDLLDELSPAERAVIVLADFEPHRSMGEIAGVLDITEEAARSRHRRARERMRSMLTGQRERPSALALLPSVALLDLDQLLATEAPPPSLSPNEHAALRAQVLETIAGNALALGRGKGKMFSAGQAAVVALVAFALGGVSVEALRTAPSPVPVALATEATATIVASVTLPSVPTSQAAPSATFPVLVASAAPATPRVPSALAAPASTATPLVASSDLESEWQALRDARALLRGKHPSPEAALDALKRVHAEPLRSVREQLRTEAESLRAARVQPDPDYRP